MAERAISGAGPVVADVDGNTEDRSGTISVFNGPPPEIRVLSGEDEEVDAVGTWIAQRVMAGVLPHEGRRVRSRRRPSRSRPRRGY